jgi:DNA-binding winged helix-turn-helix (wHTH) protein
MSVAWAQDALDAHCAFGPFTVDLSRRVVFKNGVPLRLTLKCVELLIAFVRHPHRVLTKEELLETVWHDASASDATLAQHVFLLRRALTPEGESWIQTLPQIGYRFVADVSVAERSERADVQAYCDGAQTFLALMTEQGLRSAMELYARVIELDGSSARAYAGRARCLRLLAQQMCADPLHTLSGAKSDAAKAYEQSASHLAALVELAYVSVLFDRDWKSGAEYLAAARAEDPADGAVRELDVWLPLMRGDFGAAYRAVRSHSPAMLGYVLYFSRDYAAAQAYFEHRTQEDSGAQVTLAATRLLQGDVQRAIEELSAVYRAEVDVRERGEFSVRHYALAYLIYAYARSGDTSRAREELADLARLNRERYISPMVRAIGHAALGETDSALAFLEEAVMRFDPWTASIAVDPFLDEVRSHPRFKQLLRVVSGSA